jgi:hypothetical protein
VNRPRPSGAVVSISALPDGSKQQNVNERRLVGNLQMVTELSGLSDACSLQFRSMGWSISSCFLLILGDTTVRAFLLDKGAVFSWTRQNDLFLHALQHVLWRRRRALITFDFDFNGRGRPILSN